MALLFLVYVSSSFGLVGSNDGSHFSATRALVDQGTFRIGDGTLFAIEDVALHQGRRYSNKPPGTALLAVPLYALGKWLDQMFPLQPTNGELRWYASEHEHLRRFGYEMEFERLVRAHAETRWRQDCVSLTAAFAGVLAVWLTLRICLLLDCSPASAALAAFALALGTLHWRYSTAFFAHVFSSTLLLLQLERLLSGRAFATMAAALSWGLLVGANVAVEYQAALCVPFLLFGWGWRASGVLSLRAWLVRFSGVLMGGGVVALLLAWYHTRYFGSPFRTPVAASEFFDYVGKLQDMFGGNLREGARVLLMNSDGLFTRSPFLYLSIAGCLVWPRRHRWFLILIAVLTFVHCALTFNVVNPNGGGTFDHRYLVRIIPLLVLPLGILVHRCLQLQRSIRWIGLTLLTVVLGYLLVESFLQNLFMVSGFMKHGVLSNPHLFSNANQPMVFISRLLSGIFPSAGRFELLSLGLALYVPLAFLASRFACLIPYADQEQSSRLE